MADSQMKIAMLSVHSCPLGHLGTKDTGGMSVYVRELARELGKLGQIVDVYTRAHDPVDEQIIRLGQNARLIHLNAGEEEEIDKLAVYPHLPDFTDSLEDFRKNEGLKYDLIFSHYWLSGWVGRSLQRWWNVPHFMMFHTLGAAKNAVGIGEAEPELRIERERQLARECHHIITATGKERDEVVRRCGASPDRISVIPCGVNLELFQPVDKKLAKERLGFKGEKLVLYVGRIEPLKGIDRLLGAMPYLNNGIFPRLVVIGGGEHSQDEMERLKRLSRDFNIGDSVTFLGLIEQEKLPLFYSAADVFVVPSYYETFGLVALEAMACGTPVVATNVGGFQDVIRQGETGYIVPDNSPRNLADKIARLLSKPDVDGRTALSIRDSIRHLGWSNIACAVAEQCREVLADYLAPVV